MADSKLHKEKGKTRRGIYGDDVPTIVNQYFDRKCGKIDGKLSRNEKREKELRKEICNRWAALGFTDELGVETRKKLTELLEGWEEEDRFPIVLRRNDKFPLWPPEIDNPFKNN